MEHGLDYHFREKLVKLLNLMTRLYLK